MINELAPKSAVAVGIRRLAELVTGRVPQPLQKVTPFLSFLKGKKRA